MKKKKIITLSLIAAAVFAGGIFFLRDEPPAEQSSAARQEVSVSDEEKKDEPAPEPEFDEAKIGAAVQTWVGGHSGLYGVAVTDSSGKALASASPDREFFAASIYKLYVAYAGYQKIDDGTYSLAEPYLNGWTRGKCLDEMIRTSNSPCAEKMWTELGKESLENQLKSYGLKNTSMTALRTSAGDTAIILARLQSGEGIGEDSRRRMLESMNGQIYRDALAKGFAPLKVYNKVGFNGYVEYHDTAIVEFSDGRHLIVSVLTENAGTRNIAGLAQAIKTVAE